MKKLITILLLLISINSFSQSYSKKQAQLKRLSYYTLAISLDAVGDALYDEGYKDWGHLSNGVSVLTTLVIPFDKDMKILFKEYDSPMLNIVANVAIYTLIRYAVFDLVYNSVRGLPFNYTGRTDFIDKSIGSWGDQTFAKGIVLTFVISLNFKK